MRASKVVGAIAFGVFWTFNPAFVGSGSLPITKFSFDEGDVVALVDVAKTHRYELRTADGTYEVAINLAQRRGDDSKFGALQASPVRVAHACGGRSFLRSAAACLEVTTVPVDGTITVRRISPEIATLVDRAEANGRLEVFGTELNSAYVTIAAGEHKLRLATKDAKTFAVDELVIDGKRLDRPTSAQSSRK